MSKSKPQITCFFCKRTLDKHPIAPCLADFRFLVTGSDCREEGYYSPQEREKVLKKYRDAIYRTWGKKLSLKVICDRIEHAIAEGWASESDRPKLLEFFLGHFNTITKR